MPSRPLNLVVIYSYDSTRVGRKARRKTGKDISARVGRVMLGSATLPPNLWSERYVACYRLKGDFMMKKI